MPVKIVIRENGKQWMMQIDLPVKTTEQLYRGDSHIVFQSVCGSVLWNYTDWLYYSWCSRWCTSGKIACIVRCKCLWKLLSEKMAINAWCKCPWKITPRQYEYTAASFALFFTCMWIQFTSWRDWILCGDIVALFTNLSYFSNCVGNHHCIPT